jgi:hypothetical protein
MQGLIKRKINDRVEDTYVLLLSVDMPDLEPVIRVSERVAENVIKAGE